MKHTFLMLTLAFFFAGQASSLRANTYDGYDDGAAVTDAIQYRMEWHKARYLVTLLYRGVLFREPDEQGLDAWSRQVAQGGYGALIEVAADFGSSPEFNSAVYSSHGTPEILQHLYNVLLQRDVDQQGWAAWLPLLNEHQGAQVVSGIVRSDEFRRLHHID